MACECGRSVGSGRRTGRQSASEGGSLSHGPDRTDQGGRADVAPDADPVEGDQLIAREADEPATMTMGMFVMVTGLRSLTSGS